MAPTRGQLPCGLLTQRRSSVLCRACGPEFLEEKRDGTNTGAATRAHSDSEWCVCEWRGPGGHSRAWIDQGGH